MICKKCKKEIADESVFCNYCGAKQITTQRVSKKRGNGQGSVFKLPNGKYKAEVVLYYYVQDGKVKKKRATREFTRRTDAIAWIPNAKPAKTEEVMTLKQLYEIFVESKKYAKLSKSQQNKLLYAWNRLQPLHYRNIADLTVDEMQTAIDKAVSTYYPARDMKVMLSHLFTLAIQREKVQYNKTEYLELPEFEKAKNEAFTESEMQAFWDDYNGTGPDGKAHPFTGYILIMIYAGLRYGELARIEKSKVFLDKRYMIGGIKTEEGIDREIAIADRIMPIVREVYMRGRKKLLEMNEDNFYNQYWETINRVGARELPPQTCRHTFFSRMASAGVAGAVVAKAGGHTNYNTTYKNYINIPLSDKLDGVNKI
jgi:integrase